MDLSSKRLIVGLGNPGKEYSYTRHNLGFLVVQELAKKNKLSFSKDVVAQGFLAEGKIKGCPVSLFMPVTYMNNSGAAVRKILLKKEIDPSDALIVCDDINLPFGQLRLRSKGSDGGHNGLKSIIYSLESSNFARLRIGIGRGERKEKDMSGFVLEEFNGQEKEQLGEVIQNAVDCCFLWLKVGINKAMSQFNKRKEDDE